jgi:hypothetical protein
MQLVHVTVTHRARSHSRFTTPSMSEEPQDVKPKLNLHVKYESNSSSSIPFHVGPAYEEVQTSP